MLVKQRCSATESELLLLHKEYKVKWSDYVCCGSKYDLETD